MGSCSSVMMDRTGKDRNAGVKWGWPRRGRDYSCLEWPSRDLVIEGLRAVWGFIDEALITELLQCFLPEHGQV